MTSVLEYGLELSLKLFGYLCNTLLALPPVQYILRTILHPCFGGITHSREIHLLKARPVSETNRRLKHKFEFGSGHENLLTKKFSRFPLPIE